MIYNIILYSTSYFSILFYSTTLLYHVSSDMFETEYSRNSPFNSPTETGLCCVVYGFTLRSLGGYDRPKYVSRVHYWLLYWPTLSYMGLYSLLYLLLGRSANACSYDTQKIFRPSPVIYQLSTFISILIFIFIFIFSSSSFHDRPQSCHSGLRCRYNECLPARGHPSPTQQYRFCRPPVLLRVLSTHRCATADPNHILPYHAAHCTYTFLATHPSPSHRPMAISRGDFTRVCDTNKPIAAIPCAHSSRTPNFPTSDSDDFL
jgi:hypothetical protein